MKPFVAIGNSRSYRPQRAIIVYHDERAQSEVFATVHPIQANGRNVPTLGAGSLVTAAFLHSLAEGLGSSLKPEVLPPNVLCRTPQLIAWWTPAAWRPLFFRKGSVLGKVSGKHFPVPPLVWKIVGREMSVRALKLNTRPDAQTTLHRAPFWNTNQTGLVCQGSMRKPTSVTASSLEEWVDGYFSAEFTHVFDQFGAGDATSHKGGMPGMWAGLAGSRLKPRPFPTKYLVSAKETLQQFIERGGGRA